MFINSICLHSFWNFDLQYLIHNSRINTLKFMILIPKLPSIPIPDLKHKTMGKFFGNEEIVKKLFRDFSFYLDLSRI